MLREEIKSCTFGLEKKHCDAFDLQDAWTNGKIKENAKLLAALFNLNRIAMNVDGSNKKQIYLNDMIFDSDDDSDDADDEATETPSCRTITKSIRAYYIYQMMVYTITDGKIKTPLHVITGQSVYSGCRSRSTITSFDKIGVFTSYDNMRRVRALLTSYAIKKNQNNLTPIPSHFQTDPGAGFVSGAFDNTNMRNRSSTSGTKTTDYCALVVFQDTDDTLTRNKKISIED